MTNTMNLLNRRQSIELYRLGLIPHCVAQHCPGLKVVMAGEYCVNGSKKASDASDHFSDDVDYSTTPSLLFLNSFANYSNKLNYSYNLAKTI